jgi:hypothetical protein
MNDPSAKPRSQSEPGVWVSALIAALTGLATGAVIWITLMGVRHVFGLDELDRDFGLSVRRVVREIGRPSTMILREGQEHAAVFLDIDAIDDKRESGACQAMSAAVPDRYPDLVCSSARPLNRFLLAQVVEDLDRRRPAAIVLDIALRRDEGVVSNAENAALEAAVVKAQSPILFAMPVDQLDAEEDNLLVRGVQLHTDVLALTGRSQRLGGVALPEAEQPIRRYAKCFRITGTSRWVGNLAFLAAAVLRGHDVSDVDALCESEARRAGGNADGSFAPRIEYALPSLSLLRIRDDAERLPSREALLRARYQNVYVRCRATDFWTKGSSCALGDTYAGKVVVVGTSNPLRRDLHATPLGTMAGAEVVLNAIRSFELAPARREGESGWKVVKEGVIDLLAAAAMWFLYFAARARLHRQGVRRPSLTHRALRQAVLAALFTATLAMVLARTVWQGYESLTILGGVMGVAAEQFIDLVNRMHGKIRSVLKRVFGLTVLLVLLLPGRARAELPRCPDAILGVSALVTRVEPAGQTFFKQTADGRPERIGYPGVVCVGESVVLSVGGSVLRVELYVGYRIEEVTPDRPFHNKGGVFVAARRSVDFLAQVLGVGRELRPPPQPRVTESRGGPADGAAVRPIHALQALRDLPPQRLTPDTPPVLAWREGKGPYRCEARKEGTWKPTASVTADAQTAWCVIPGNPEGVAQLLVVDARGGRDSWDVQAVAWADVPRPAWLPAAPRAASVADRAAWALWLWKNAGPTWRLQGLAMLNQLAPAIWAAAFARDGILAGVPSLLPDEGEAR